MSSPVTYNASTRESAWQNFVAGTPGCESVAGTQNTFDCLQAANSSAIFEEFVEAYALAIEGFPFDPAPDGPSGLLPDLPFTTLGKGRVCYASFHFRHEPRRRYDMNTLQKPNSTLVLVRNAVLVNKSQPHRRGHQGLQPLTHLSHLPSPMLSWNRFSNCTLTIHPLGPHMAPKTKRLDCLQASREWLRWASTALRSQHPILNHLSQAGT